VKRQQSLTKRLRTLAALHDAVGAMRSLSAHHFRRVRQALPAARTYRDEIDTILAEIGIHQPLHAGLPAGLLVVASDLGLCGDYNSRLARRAVTEAEIRAVRTVYLVGRRPRAALAKHDLSPWRTYDAPASLEGITRLLLGLAEDLLEDYLAGKFGSLHVISAAFDGVGHCTPQSTRVLPVTPVPAAAPPRRSPYNESGHVLQAAVGEFLYVTLYGLLLDALAAEHGMRLVAAQSALEWLDKTRATTSRQLANARTEASTQELLDIVSGRQQRLRGSL
jgi:F-type H+-transporting ATPase subunit gamma